MIIKIVSSVCVCVCDCVLTMHHAHLHTKEHLQLRQWTDCLLFLLWFSFLHDDRLNESNWSGYQGGGSNSNSSGAGPQLQWASAYGSTSVNNGNLVSAAAAANSNSRVVVIHRDDRGFGFVVAGDNPVFVQTVREGKSRSVFFLSLFILHLHDLLFY